MLTALSDLFLFFLVNQYFFLRCTVTASVVSTVDSVGAFLHRQRHGFPLWGCSVGLLRPLMQQGPNTIQGQVGFLKSTWVKTVVNSIKNITENSVKQCKTWIKTMNIYNTNKWVYQHCFLCNDAVSTIIYHRWCFATANANKQNDVKRSAKNWGKPTLLPWLQICSPARRPSISNKRHWTVTEPPSDLDVFNQFWRCINKSKEDKNWGWLHEHWHQNQNDQPWSTI